MRKHDRLVIFRLALRSEILAHREGHVPGFLEGRSAPANSLEIDLHPEGDGSGAVEARKEHWAMGAEVQEHIRGWLQVKM
jgi:hypothetical protein